MRYKHYKGAVYEKITDGTSVATGIKQTVYKNTKTGEVWIRSSEIFNGHTKLDGVIVKRFVEMK